MDLVGPYPVGRDDGRRRKGKYILVATVPLPMLDRVNMQEKEETAEEDVDHSLDGHAGDQHGLNLNHDLMKEINLMLININHNQKKECLWKRWTRSSRWRW